MSNSGEVPRPESADPGPPAGAWAGHTRWQRFSRFLFRFFGPAQTGLPPYATPEEERALRQDQTPRASPPIQAPPGYEFQVYVDEQGVTHRSLVRTEADGEGQDSP